MDLHRCLQSHRYLSVDESLFTIGLSQSIFIFWCIYSSRLRTPSWCSAFRVASQFGLRPHCFSSWEVCGRFCFFTFRGHCVHTDGQTDGHGQIDSASNPDQEYIYIFYGDGNLSFCLLHTFRRI